MVFGPSGRDHDSPKSFIWILETPRYLEKHKKILKHFQKYDDGKYLFSINSTIGKWKGGHRQIPKIRRMTYWKSWIWDQYLSTKQEMEFLNHWIFESLKFLKLELCNFNSGNSRNSQRSNCHPCTSSPLGGHEWTWSKIGPTSNLVQYWLPD